MTGRFLFRLAAGPRLGFGHLMRCRALARALDVRPVVSIRGGAAARRQADAMGCAVHKGGLRHGDVLIVDDPSPAHAGVWLQRAARAGVPAATIHDLHVGSRAADLVIDGSVTRAPAFGRRVLSGPRYAILDARVSAARAARRRRDDCRVPQRVLIALGGGSHVLAAARPLVKAIARRCPAVTIQVVSGFCRSDARRPLTARRRASSTGRLAPLGVTPDLHHGALAAARWIERRDGLAMDLAQCDVALVGGGITLYEACAVGVPIVALAVVAAQRPAIAAFAARGAAIDAGALADGATAIRRAADEVAGLLGDARARRRRSSAARAIVDGHGAHRVAARIRSLGPHRERGRSGRG